MQHCALKDRIGLGICAAIMLTVVGHAVWVLQPLSADTTVLRGHAAELAALSSEVEELSALLVSLRHVGAEEIPSYQSMLQRLRGWHFEAHAYIAEIAVRAGLSVTAMEWGTAAPVTPAFDTDPHQRWLRTEVFISLAGTWQAHRDFSHHLSRCDCLVQVMEEEMTAAADTHDVSASISLSIYHPAEGARV